MKYPTLAALGAFQKGNWLPRLNNWQLGAFWEDMAYGDWGEVSEDQIKEGVERIDRLYEADTEWVLKTLPIETIEGHHTGHDASEEYIEDYKKKKQEGSAFPPLIVEPDDEHPGKYKTIDGQHRLFAAKALGEKEILAYVPDLSYPTVKSVLAGEPVSQRALAKATIPEDSELMEFYYLADRGGWSEQVREEGEAEWDRMDEGERREIIPTLISHGYSDHFPKDPKTEQDWREVRDYFLSYWEDMEEENSNQSTELFFENAKIIKNPTLVRFTNRPEDVGETFPGYGPHNLGLTFHYRPRSGDLAFAFDVKDLEPDDWKSYMEKYGKYVFQFKVPYAVKAHHITDGEDQVVFDVNTVKDLKEIKPKPKSKRGVPL